MKKIKRFIVHLLGGISKEDFEQITKEQNERHNEIVSNLENHVIANLREENRQLDRWFLAFTDAIHNFSAKSFNNVSCQRISTVATTYRMLSCYSIPYEIIEEDLFVELQDFVSQVLFDVFRTGDFSDEAFNHFESLEVKIRPFINTKHLRKC